ncbi:MAG: polymerase subunit delta [Herbaspirillum sp.]|jgi:DNA polymerase-3 subunit delta'|nr:polymerase subunit delta [Herbaspirillum sp.]
MSDILFPWQQESWRQLQQLRARLPHAILLYGAEGIGKTHFAEAFAQSLLCEAPLRDGYACGQCAACNWFAQQNHPDFRRVRPEALDDDDSGDTDGGEEKKTAKAAKAPSKEIKIDQIRALADFMNVSTHRSGMRVVMLYPAEALNNAAANALLKTLEEPPPNTVFILSCNRLDRLLPTILSRCRKFALASPSRQQALDWLQQQQLADADVWLAEQGGAPLAALSAAQSEGRDVRDELIGFLLAPTAERALKTAERLQKTPLIMAVGWTQRWLYDLLSSQMASIIRYYPRHGRELQALAGRVETPALLAALKQVNDRRAIAEHPLSAKLFIEDMLLVYAALF